MMRRLNAFLGFMGLLILFVFNMQVSGKMVVNYSDASFEEQSRGQMETYVVEAAGYFLKSQSDLFLFLNKIELSDLEGADFTALRSIIDNAAANMQNANAKYSELTAAADSRSYNQTLLDQLTAFDYHSFRENKGLNRVIYDEVEAYLKVGDVRGVYHKLNSDTQYILGLLAVLKSAVDRGTLPAMEDVWKTSRAYANAFLFGQYTAEIFYEITGK
jgi:hypothetical protein